MNKIYLLLVTVFLLSLIGNTAGARWYSPEMGRFISEDPIMFAGGNVNFYVYVNNSPLNFSDPFGLRVQLCRRDLNNALNMLSAFDDRLHHSFIYIDQNEKVPDSTFGFTSKDWHLSMACVAEGPGHVEEDLPIDRFAAREGYMHGSCEVIDCPNEAKLIEGITQAIANPPYYCFLPNKEAGINCQEWTSMMINQYCRQ